MLNGSMWGLCAEGACVAAAFQSLPGGGLGDENECVGFWYLASRPK